METRQEMNTKRLLLAVALILVTAMIGALSASFALAASASEIDRSATQSLTTLYKNNPGAKALADKAKGVLIFPRIVKGGYKVNPSHAGVCRQAERTILQYPQKRKNMVWELILAGSQSFIESAAVCR